MTLSDYEYFVPWAAHRAGVPCLSVDHQHVITACRHPVPWRHYPSYLSTAMAATVPSPTAVEICLSHLERTSPAA